MAVGLVLLLAVLHSPLASGDFVSSGRIFTRDVSSSVFYSTKCNALSSCTSYAVKLSRSSIDVRARWYEWYSTWGRVPFLALTGPKRQQLFPFRLFAGLSPSGCWGGLKTTKINLGCSSWSFKSPSFLVLSWSVCHLLAPGAVIYSAWIPNTRPFVRLMVLCAESLSRKVDWVWACYASHLPCLKCTGITLPFLSLFSVSAMLK